jgi:C4-dicarboxylate-specific signal transduction histidine kinase
VRLGHEQLVQVFLNLIMNAADALGGRGSIELLAERSMDGVRIVVTDDGPGVAEAVREHLFEPFVTTKDVGKGTGLGLAVSRGLVESAGGTLELDASHARGARFVIELPAAPGWDER